MPDNLYDHFFHDFPELEGRVCFIGDDERTENFLQQVRSTNPTIHDAIERLVAETQDRVCTMWFPHGENHICIVNIPEKIDFLATIHAPLIRHEGDLSAFKEIASHHEIGHAILQLLHPAGLPHFNGAWKSKADMERESFSERFADAYASLKFIQEHESEGTALVKRFSDLRILSALKKSESRHLTYIVLDSIAQRFPNGDELKDLSSMRIAHMALGIALEHNYSYMKMEDNLQQWQKAVSDPTYQDLSQPSIPRLFKAINNQLNVPVEAISKFVFDCGFKPGELKTEFLKSGAMKAVVGLDMSSNPYEDIAAVKGHIEEFIFSGGRHGSSDNQFPGLGVFLKRAVGTFAGNRYALLNAAASPAFLNDMVHRHFMRQRIITLSQAPQIL